MGFGELQLWHNKRKNFEEYFEYLDEMREEGEYNMLMGPRFLQQDYGLSREQAKIVFQTWVVEKRSGSVWS